jgi:hypothetical protein
MALARSLDGIVIFEEYGRAKSQLNSKMVDHGSRNLISVREPVQLLKQLQQYQQSQTRRRLTGASGDELDLLFGWSEIKNQLVGADRFGKPRINSLFVERHWPPPSRGRRSEKEFFKAYHETGRHPNNVTVLVENARIFSHLHKNAAC